MWTSSRIIYGHDGKTRGVKTIMGKTKTIISKPANKVYPLELVEENEEIKKMNREIDHVGKQQL